MSLRTSYAFCTSLNRSSASSSRCWFLSAPAISGGIRRRVPWAARSQPAHIQHCLSTATVQGTIGQCPRHACMAISQAVSNTNMQKDRSALAIWHLGATSAPRHGKPFLWRRRPHWRPLPAPALRQPRSLTVALLLQQAWRCDAHPHDASRIHCVCIFHLWLVPDCWRSSHLVVTPHADAVE